MRASKSGIVTNGQLAPSEAAKDVIEVAKRLVAMKMLFAITLEDSMISTASSNFERKEMRNMYESASQ